MNFDFLKNLRGLGHIYENCNNAEKLAINMPVQSVFTSRKSAELMAKFIYMAAHNQQMEELTFADILSDYTFKKFIDNRDILDAFHYIRKSGNQAVYGEVEKSPEDAVTVLQDLHFVAGETACMLGLINNYPIFDDNIMSFPKAVYIDEKDIDEKARKMFLAYVEEYDAQVERNAYYQRNIDNLISEFDSMGSIFQIVPGEVDLNEVLEFKTKPVHPGSLKPIQAYYGFLGIHKIKENRGELCREIEGRNIEFTGELSIYGENGYTTSDLDEFVYGVLKDLPLGYFR